jgi:Tfp pilus assembly protein PilW
MTLVELLVAMMVSIVLVVIVSQVTMTSMRAFRFTQTKTTLTATSRTAMERMVKLLRVAVVPSGLTSAFSTASYEQVRFYASWKHDASASDPAPTYVEFYWDSTTSCLAEATTPATGSAPPYSWPVANRTTRCLLKLASAPTNAAPLFSYYSSATLNSDGTAPTAMTVPASGGLTVANQQLVRAVGITMSVVDPGNTDIPPVLSNDRVTLDNLVLSAAGRA